MRASFVLTACPVTMTCTPFVKIYKYNNHIYVLKIMITKIIRHGDLCFVVS